MLEMSACCLPGSTADVHTAILRRAQQCNQLLPSVLQHDLAYAEKRAKTHLTHGKAVQVVLEELTVCRADVLYDALLLFESITQGAEQAPVGVKALECPCVRTRCIP